MQVAGDTSRDEHRTFRRRMSASIRTVSAIGLLSFAAFVGPAVAGDLKATEPRAISLAVQDRNGRDHGLGEISGRLKLLHFWASWCGSCRTEFPAIDAFQRDMRDRGVTVAAVSLDRYGWSAIDKTIDTLGIREVSLYHDRDRAAAQAVGVVGLPTTLVVDAEGREIARVIGAGAWEDPAFRAKIEAMMGK